MKGKDTYRKGNGGESGGSLFLSLLAVALIVLKLVGVITWRWIWVLAPIWIPVAMVLIIFIVFLILGIKNRG